MGKSNSKELADVNSKLIKNPILKTMNFSKRVDQM
jgi:hypothetical protein